MKFSLPTFLFAVIVSVLISVWLSPSQNTPTDSKKETAFERILRTKTIRCGYATWPPYLVKDPNTKTLSGFTHDYTQEIARVLDLKIEWSEEVDWGNYIEGLKTHRYDMMCMNDWAVGERLKYATVSKPIGYSALYAYARAEDNRFDGNLSALDSPDISLAVIDGDTTYNVARLNFPKAQLHALPQNTDGSQLMLEVALKKADAVIIDVNMAEQYLTKNPGKMKQVANTTAVQVFPEVYVMKQGERELKDMIDGAISLLTDSGFTDRLIERYQVDLRAPQKGF